MMIEIHIRDLENLVARCLDSWLLLSATLYGQALAKVKKATLSTTQWVEWWRLSKKNPSLVATGLWLIPMATLCPVVPSEEDTIWSCSATLSLPAIVLALYTIFHLFIVSFEIYHREPISASKLYSCQLILKEIHLRWCESSLKTSVSRWLEWLVQGLMILSL